MSKRRKKSVDLVCPYPDCASGRVYKTLKTGNLTRCCGRPVVRVNNAIYLKLDDAPEWQIIQRFVEHKCKRDPEYEIQHGDKPYRQAVKAAAVLHKYCKGNLELACTVVDVSFTHKAHRWRDYPVMWAIVSAKFVPDTIAKARAALAKQRERQDRQRRATRSAVDGHEYVNTLYAGVEAL